MLLHKSQIVGRQVIINLDMTVKFDIVSSLFGEAHSSNAGQSDLDSRCDRLGRAETLAGLQPSRSSLPSESVNPANLIFVLK
jgi:hypothetical protein